MMIIEVDYCNKADKSIFEDGMCPCYLHDDYIDEHICMHKEHDWFLKKQSMQKLFEVCSLKELKNEK